ncbi:MAG: ADP-ribosylation factor-like protein [Candidatus Hodarchaeota archaeon]
MTTISEQFLNASCETLHLIQRLLNYLEQQGKRLEFVNFLSQIEGKANVRINSMLQQSSENPSPEEEQSNHPDYWRGVRDTVKSTKVQFLTNGQNFSQYLSDKRNHLLEAQKQLEMNNKGILQIADLIIQGGKISVLGLDRAGKTTMLQRLKTGRWMPNTQPTIGMNAETIRINNVRFTAWDLGGQIQYRRALWDMYTKNSVGLIYVIDLSDPERFPEARLNLWTMLEKIHLQGLPLAIFANKIDVLQDRDEVFSITDLKNSMGITKKMNRRLKIFKTSAKTGEGISEGIYWLSDAIIMNLDNSNQRVHSPLEDPPTPKIYYAPYPKGPPVASAEAISKKIEEFCPNCGEINKIREESCKKCGASLIPFS